MLLSVACMGSFKGTWEFSHALRHRLCLCHWLRSPDCSTSDAHACYLLTFRCACYARLCVHRDDSVLLDRARAMALSEIQEMHPTDSGFDDLALPRGTKMGAHGNGRNVSSSRQASVSSAFREHDQDDVGRERQMTQCAHRADFRRVRTHQHA